MIWVSKKLLIWAEDSLTLIYPYLYLLQAGGDAKESSLTAEPAVVVPVDTDLGDEVLDGASPKSSSVKIVDSDIVDLRRKAYQQGRLQSGAILRRAAQSLSILQPSQAQAVKEQPGRVRSQESDEF